MRDELNFGGGARCLGFVNEGGGRRTISLIPLTLGLESIGFGVGFEGGGRGAGDVEMTPACSRT